MNSSTGNMSLAKIVTIAILATAGLFGGIYTWTANQYFTGTHTSINHLELPNGQINYSNHIQTLPLNTGTLLDANSSGASLSNLPAMSSVTNTGHTSTGPLNTGTILNTNGSLASLTGTLGSSIGVTTLSNSGHVSTFPTNTGTLLQTNGTLNGGTLSGSIAGNPTTTGNWIMSGVEDFGYMADKFGSGSILVRNPASTFATAINNAAQTHNRTATLPLTTGNTTFAMQPIFNFTSPSNKTGTSSGTPVMLGAFATLTPRYSGNATVIVTGYSSSGTLLDGCKLSARYSSSSLGANGAALAGTQIGSNLIATSATANANIPFEITGIVTGLTAGNKEYYDLSEGAAIGGTCTVFNVNWNIREQ